MSPTIDPQPGWRYPPTDWQQRPRTYTYPFPLLPPHERIAASAERIRKLVTTEANALANLRRVWT